MEYCALKDVLLDLLDLLKKVMSTGSTQLSKSKETVFDSKTLKWLNSSH